LACGAGRLIDKWIALIPERLHWQKKYGYPEKSSPTLGATSVLGTYVRNKLAKWNTLQQCSSATLQHCKGAAPSPMNPGGEGHIIDSIRPDTGGTQAEEGKSGGDSELGRTCE